MRPAPRRTAVLAAAVLALPLAAVAAQAAPSPAAVAQAPGRTAILPSTVTPVPGLRIENSFVSSTGWVKPGDAYPSRILLTNAAKTAAGAVSVSIPARKGMTWTAARAATGVAALSGGTVTWKVPSVPAGSTLALILEGRAKTTAQEPTVVWRDISSTASVTAGGVTKKIASRGPKVIPASGGFESARYGDRPFPVVPVDYIDFKHTASAGELDKVINDPKNPSSTFNLYQEMSFGQLYPHGTIGSAGVASRPVKDTDRLRFSKPEPTQTNTCTGTTTVNPADGRPTAMYSERISDGWYQLPGMRGYYGSDANGSALVGAIGGVGALQAIDSGCGPTAKAAYDAAVVADPDIDYSDFDTDKDGVVDFFEVIFQGCGGNGESQLSAAADCNEAPNDNIWPHSSSLEFSYTDPATGLTGYISHDQLKNLEGQPLWYTDKSYTTKTTKNLGDALKVFVRVGPYNVNPETAIAFASVISHEYGHSLGLPDYYSTGSRDTYGDFTLMATDKSHNMDVIGKKELGWIVPDVLAPSKTKAVKDWQDSKIDTGAIHWVTPSGTPYTLSAAAGDYGIHNGEAYVASLPGRQLLDPKKIAQGASGKQVWYSGQGNDFGCPVNGGHNLDFVVPGLDKVPAGTKVTVSFKSFFDIEWDYDYAFLLTGKPGDKGAYSYTSHPSDNGYTTPAATNPNQNTCQSKYGNGITGTPASYDAGTAPVDRVAGNYPDSPFVKDSYDISDLAGVKGGTLRFTYSSDPGLARLGWIMDDLVVKAGDKVLFSSDFEKGDGGVNDPRVYPGGCKEDLSVSGGVCTEGWKYIAAGTPSELEHAYLLEMRDRSGFDFDGRGENNRAPIAFEPGVLLTYTDEAHGYGNVGTDNPPAQSPLDAKPQPENDSPNLNDATFTTASGRSRFSDQRGKGAHVDNYSEPARNAELDPDGDGAQPWTFDYNCLSFDVTRLAGDTGNAADKYDLVGDATFVTKAGCAPFNYGLTAAAVRKPTTTVPSTPSGSETGNGQGNGQNNSGNADGEESGGGTASGAPTRRAGLPRTGQDVAVAVAIALLMLTGGGWLTATRRSRTA
ncbi:MAG: immune inhibitor A [Actinobacteria bacterium]|nr:immune inhibitor A [Actinomycetota bacterium]MCA1719709.1 immune inhibitor A [Actinomycetota bacterium]